MEEDGPSTGSCSQNVLGIVGLEGESTTFTYTTVFRSTSADLSRRVRKRQYNFLRDVPTKAADPLRACRQAQRARDAQRDELADITYVEYAFRNLPSNRHMLWTPRMALPPPRLSTLRCELFCGDTRPDVVPSASTIGSSADTQDPCGPSSRYRVRDFVPLTEKCSGEYPEKLRTYADGDTIPTPPITPPTSASSSGYGAFFPTYSADDNQGSGTGDGIVAKASTRVDDEHHDLDVGVSAISVSSARKESCHDAAPGGRSRLRTKGFTGRRAGEKAITAARSRARRRQTRIR